MAKQYVDAKRTIAVDWNGVLDTYAGYKGPEYTYPPRPGAKEFLERLTNMGYKIVIMTAAHIDVVQHWLEDNEMLPFVAEVTDQKVPAIVYLDDRAITFDGNFEKALLDIITFKTHWEGRHGSDQV